MEVYPDLVGKNYKTDIKNSTLYTHYRIAMTEDFSSTVPEGCVIRQEPVAGTLVTEQAPTIQLVVSKGPMLVEMPDIIGWTQNNASKSWMNPASTIACRSLKTMASTQRTAL